MKHFLLSSIFVFLSCLHIVKGQEHKKLNLYKKKYWDTNTFKNWTFTNGKIKGCTVKEDNIHYVLLTNQKFENFDLECEFKINHGNSGIYIRVDTVRHNVKVKGFQVEVDPLFNAGGIYETLGRQWVNKADTIKVKQVFKQNDWNKLSIKTRNRDVTTYLNGLCITQLKNDSSRTKGFIGLQLHGYMDMEVAFRNIYLTTTK